MKGGKLEFIVDLHTQLNNDKRKVVAVLDFLLIHTVHVWLTLTHAI